MIIESPLDLIFRDLFYRVPSFARRNDVFLKLEGFNVTGSIKIKTAIALVEDLEQRGVARTDETVIVESSSGNLGLALSLVCAAKCPRRGVKRPRHHSQAPHLNFYACRGCCPGGGPVVAVPGPNRLKATDEEAKGSDRKCTATHRSAC